MGTVGDGDEYQRGQLGMETNVVGTDGDGDTNFHDNIKCLW